MQKFVTIYLDNTAYAKPKSATSYAEKHGFVEEHLQEYLADGWQVRSMFGFGGADGYSTRGWVAVVLEKEES